MELTDAGGNANKTSSININLSTEMLCGSKAESFIRGSLALVVVGVTLALLLILGGEAAHLGGASITRGA